MGRKKQRVRWTSVEDGFFEDSEGNMVLDEGLPKAEIDYDETSTNGGSNYDPSFAAHRQSSNYHGHHQQQHYYRKSYYGQPRRHGPGWSNGPVAPRFERKAAEGRGSYCQDGNSESEEHLPDGFTKIRSKNLDVLFRKDYYAQRAHLSPSQTSSTAVSSEHGDDETVDDPNEDREHVLDAVPEPLEEVEESEEKPTEGEDEQTETQDNPEVKEDAEERKNDLTKKSVINGHASPFYPSGYISPTPPIYVSQQQNARPNLFLYSPTSNTMIPCEEIVIPNPVVGPDGGTIYQGPSNIYLAFPVENGGMTSPGGMHPHQQYPQYMGPPMSSGPMVHYDQYGVPYTSYQQQPSTLPTAPPSVDAGSPPVTIESEDQNSITYTSETSIEPSSADSTTPHSPPDLSVYSPANWADSNGYIHHNNYSQNQWYPQHQYYGPQHKRHYNNSRQNFYYQYHRPSYASDRPTACVPSSAGDSLAEEEEDVRQAGPEAKPKEDHLVVESCAASEQANLEAQHQRVFIPGLPEKLAAVACGSSAKRIQKKRRKKKATSPAVTSNGQESKPANPSTKSDSKNVALNNLSSSDEDLCQSAETEGANKSETQPENVEPVKQSEVESQVEEEVEVPCPTEVPVVETPVQIIEAQKEQIEEEQSSEQHTCEVVEVVPQIQSEIVTTVGKPRRRRGKRSGQHQSEKQRNAAQLRLQSSEDAQASGSNDASDDNNTQTLTSTTTSVVELGQPEEVKVCLAQEQPEEENKNAQSAVTEKKSDDQWESIPQEIKKSGEWETSTRARKSRKGGRQLHAQRRLPQEDFSEEPIEPELPYENVPSIIAEEPLKEEPAQEVNLPVPEPVEPVDPIEQVEVRETERSSSVPERSSSSAPSSRRSTLKKQNRKKRPSLDDGKSEKSSSVRPVLIQDGLIDVTDGAWRLRTVLKRPTDILDEQGLVIKDIGHGMKDGPITMGRFGLGRKYNPPDRSDEILSSIEACKLLDQPEDPAQAEIDEDNRIEDITGKETVCQDLDLD